MFRRITIQFFGPGIVAIPVWLAVACVSAAPLVEIGQNFTGSIYNVDSFSRPADGNGAAGQAHFVEFINGRFSVYSKASGTRVQTMTDDDFWINAGVTFSAGVTVTDPRIVYDATAQRWFAATVDYNPLTQATNRFLIAVSSTADPTQTWHALAFQADPTNGFFADFPTLGVDADGVYLGADMFDSVGNNPGCLLVCLPKADLLLPAPTVTNRTSSGIMSFADRGEILQPAVHLTPGSGAGQVLAVSNRGLDFQPHSTLISFSVLNAAGPGAATFSASTTINVDPYNVPINPPQPNGYSDLDDGDARFSATVYQVGTTLYAVHSINVNDLAAVRWYKIDATTLSIIQSGTITNSELDLFFPSIAANAAGLVVIGCNGCSSNTWVSSFAFVGETVGGVTTFTGPILLKAGTASYRDLQPDGTSRWGDYSATSVDPADPNRFWTIQMVPTGTTRWTTQITELIVNRPRLGVTTASGNVTLSWPSAATGFQLQTTPALNATPTWNAVSQTPATNNNQISVTVPASATGEFFRLIQPAP